MHVASAHYEAGVPKIPVASITVEDAKYLGSLYKDARVRIVHSVAAEFLLCISHSALLSTSMRIKKLMPLPTTLWLNLLARRSLRSS